MYLEKGLSRELLSLQKLHQECVIKLGKAHREYISQEDKLNWIIQISFSSHGDNTKDRFSVKSF